MLVLRSSGIEMLDIVNLIVVTVEKFITGLMNRVVAHLPGDQCFFQHTYLSSGGNTNSSASHLESCSDSPSFFPIQSIMRILLVKIILFYLPRKKRSHLLLEILQQYPYWFTWC